MAGIVSNWQNGSETTPAVEVTGPVATAAKDAVEPVPAPELSPTGPEVAVSKATAITPEHYPLDVGRYWVYRYRESDGEVVTEIERVIVQRQARPEGADLFFYDDGGVVYFENGRIFEMGTNGGLNIIPLDSQRDTLPVVYRSQGLQIEKWFGAVDTAVVVGDRRFEGCLEVITRFRAVEDEGSTAPSVSYSSFYAPGIGMVGRQTWPRDERGSLGVTLADHGTREL
jgi:hypothetical protein